MKEFFNPHSVAVVGVSEADNNLGCRIVQNLHEFAFDGIIYQVGPKGGTAFGRRIHKSVADIPDQVDLAIILVPARYVPGIMDECGKKGIRRVVIESAGFSEYSQEGEQLEDQIVDVAQQYGIRFIGPNCIGVINLQNGLVVPFAGLRDVFARGSISIISQSGGVGLSYLNVMESENLGLAKFVSIGNKRNVDECDLLEYFVEDDETQIVCMYLESISNGRRLMEIARRTSKPILVHKSNAGSLANEIAHSHTSSLSGDDTCVSAALEQVGIARFRSSHTLVNYLKMLPLPRMRGNRLAILSRSGGHAVIAADACESEVFSLAPFPEAFLRDIEKHFRASVIKLTNPLDLGDLFDFEVYTRIFEETLRLDEVDGVVFLHTYVSSVEGEKSQALFLRIDQLSREFDKPVAICLSTDEEEMSKIRKTVSYPIYTAPEDAIRSLALVRDFDHQARVEPQVVEGVLDKELLSSILDPCQKENRNPSLAESLALIQGVGIEVSPHHVVELPEQALAGFESIGGPVSMKLCAEQALHKTDVGGVLLGLSTASQVSKGFDELQQVASQLGVVGRAQVMMQPMILDGLEIIVGAKRDMTFGHVVLVGMGGIFAEVMGDVAIRLVPFDDQDAHEMLSRLRAYPLLQGVRGQPGRDLETLKSSLHAVSRLVQTVPQIKELDINPLMLGTRGQGAVAVDARVILG